MTVNDYEVTLTFRVTASSDDDVYDVIYGLMEDGVIWDMEVGSVEQLTFSEAALKEDLE
jgi:hypothetical protein